MLNEGIHVHERFDATCLQLRKMKKLKKIDLDAINRHEIKGMLRKNLPRVRIDDVYVQNLQYLVPNTRENSAPNEGFWGISCKPVSFFPLKFNHLM